MTIDPRVSEALTVRPRRRPLNRTFLAQYLLLTSYAVMTTLSIVRGDSFMTWLFGALTVVFAALLVVGNIRTAVRITARELLIVRPFSTRRLPLVGLGQVVLVGRALIDGRGDSLLLVADRAGRRVAELDGRTWSDDQLRRIAGHLDSAGVRVVEEPELFPAQIHERYPAHMSRLAARLAPHRTRWVVLVGVTAAAVVVGVSTVIVLLAR